MPNPRRNMMPKTSAAKCSSSALTNNLHSRHHPRQQIWLPACWAAALAACLRARAALSIRHSGVAVVSGWLWLRSICLVPHCCGPSLHLRHVYEGRHSCMYIPPTNVTINLFPIHISCFSLCKLFTYLDLNSIEFGMRSYFKCIPGQKHAYWTITSGVSSCLVE